MRRWRPRPGRASGRPERAGSRGRPGGGRRGGSWRWPNGRRHRRRGAGAAPGRRAPGRGDRACVRLSGLAPDQHIEEVFKTILGNCQSVVNSLASIRNKLSDAHGHGRKAVRPSARHGELAVDLAGTVATFLVST
ncbi:abortive infection family protein [Azospirillum oryzae]|uniref:abortive infection family protein n=1 Tax=Azospirillum oryzae TaxID=286727 RepID=UPI001178A6FA|nr:abortive infection family protein [Azospirillum oryzae]